MKIQRFDGGLSTRLRPQLIQSNEGTVYTNIDNEVGTLAPVRSKLASGINTNRFAYYYTAKQEWINSDTRRSYVEFEGTLYWSDGTNRPQKYDGTNQYNLGITAPTAAPTVTTSSTVEAPTTANLIPGNSGNLPSATLRYLLVNNDGTYYSAPLELTLNMTSSRPTIDNYYNRNEIGRVVFDEREADYFINTSGNFNRNVTISNVAGITYGGVGVEVYRLYAGKYYLVDTLVNSADTVNDNVYDISGNAEFNQADVAPLAGTLSYVYTFYNSATGIESAPSPVSAETDAETLGIVTLTGLQVSSDPQVDEKRIYRVGGLLTALSLVDTIPNAQTSYVDDTADTDIDGSALTASNNTAPPDNLAFLTEAYAMLFAAQGTRLRFTPIGEPDYWPEFFFIQFSVPITGIAPTTNGLLVFTEFRAHLITGTGPSSLSQYPLSGDQGCIDHFSIQRVSGAAMWASTDGICLSSGSSVTVITKDKLGKIELSPVYSALHDEVYYLIEESGSILAVDFRYGQLVKRLSLGVDSLTVGQDVLYGHLEGELYELFASNTPEELNYTSPRFIEGLSTEEKQYKKVFIYSKGDIIINILIDDILVATRTLSGEESHQIQVPHELQRGNFIQFEVTGTGEVYEIEYEAARRKNG